MDTPLTLTYLLRSLLYLIQRWPRNSFSVHDFFLSSRHASMLFNQTKKSFLPFSVKHPNKYDEKSMHTLQFLPSHLPIVSTPKMLSKTIILILVVVALFATMTMGRSLEANADDSDSLDEPRFSLRQVLSLVNGKRTSVRMSRLLCATQNRHSSPELEIWLNRACYDYSLVTWLDV